MAGLTLWKTAGLMKAGKWMNSSIQQQLSSALACFLHSDHLMLDFSKRSLNIAAERSWKIAKRSFKIAAFVCVCVFWGFLFYEEDTPLPLNHRTKWKQERLMLSKASCGWVMGWWQSLMERIDGLHCTSYCLLTPRIKLIRLWTQLNHIWIWCLYFVCQVQWLSCL